MPRPTSFCNHGCLLLRFLAVSSLWSHACQCHAETTTTTTHHHQPTNGLSPTERAFLQVPKAANARRHLRYITSQPHVAGTFGDALMSEYVVQELIEAGIPEVDVFELDVLLNYPSQRPLVELLLTKR